MKPCLLIGVLFCLLFPLQLVAQDNCTDPGGCSAVSFAAFQNTVGVVEFGNTNGKVFLKKKRTLCTDASCNSLFAMTTALVAPTTSAASLRSAIEPAQITIVTILRDLDTTKSKLLGISWDGFLDDEKASTFKTAASLNSGKPLSLGTGDNRMVNSGPAPSNDTKVVVQRLDSNAEAFKSPVTLRLNVQPQVAGTADRGLTLVLSVERDDESSLNLVFQQIANGKKAGQPETVKEPAKVTSESTETVPSVALSNIPLLGYLFAGKKMKTKGQPEKGDLIVFITPVIVRSNEQGVRATQFSLGKRVNITKTTRTNNPISEFFQTVAIDPLGRFVLYTQFNLACQKNVLKFQRINPATLIKIGSAKTLAGCADFANSPTGAYGLDVIPLQ